jgi:hypothetical protein
VGCTGKQGFAVGNSPQINVQGETFSQEYSLARRKKMIGMRIMKMNASVPRPTGEERSAIRGALFYHRTKITTLPHPGHKLRIKRFRKIGFILAAIEEVKLIDCSQLV